MIRPLNHTSSFITMTMREDIPLVFNSDLRDCILLLQKMRTAMLSPLTTTLHIQMQLPFAFDLSQDTGPRN